MITAAEAAAEERRQKLLDEGDDEELLITPIVAVCSPGDVSFEYCELPKGTTLPNDLDERKAFRCKFDYGRNS